MNVAEKCDEIRRNLHEFYSTADAKRRSYLNEWLTNVINGDEVWQFCWTLLSPSEEIHVQLFASNCVYLKLTTRFSQTLSNSPLTELENLQKILLELPRLFSNAAVRSKLCASLAVYVLHTTPDIWLDPVKNLSEKYALTNVAILLDVFSELIAEFRKLSLPLERRNVVRSCLHQNEASVANFAGQILQQTSASDVVIAESAIRCVECWIEFDNSTSLREWQEIVLLCLNKIYQSNDLISVVSKFFQNFVENAELSRLEVFNEQLFDYAGSLVSFSKQFEKSEENYEDLTKMIVSLGAHQSKFLLKLLKRSSLSAMTVINFITDLSALPGYYPVNENLSVLPVLFWYNLHEDGTVEENKEILNENLTHIRPVFARLLENLIVKLKYPPNAIYASWSSEDKEKFSYFRIDFEDTFTCCYRVIGQPMTEYLLNKLKFLLNSVNLMDPDCWQSIESIYLAYQAIGEYITVQNVHVTEFLTTVFPRTKVLLDRSAQLSNTALTLITKLNHVITDKQFLIPVYLPLITPFLNEIATVTNATLALRDLCCGRDTVLREVPADLISQIQICFENRSFHDYDRLRALSSYGYLLSVQSHEKIIARLNELLAPRLQRLRNLNDSNYANKNDLLFEFDIVSTLITSLSSGSNDQSAGPTPVFLVISQSLDLFESVYVASKGDDEITTKLCQILKGAAAAMCSDLSPLVERYCQLILMMYDRPQRSCVMNLSKTLYLLFAIEDKFQPLLSSVYNTMLNLTAEFFNQNFVPISGDWAVESFLNFAYSLAKKNWTFFSSFCNVYDTTGLSCRCLTYNDSTIVKEASVLLCEIFKHAESEYVSKIVSDYGSRLISACFERLKVEILTSCIEYIADVMFILSTNYGQHLLTWRRLLPEHHLVNSMMAEMGNKRKFREFAKQINIGCRKNVLSL